MRGLEDVSMSILRKALKMLEKHPLCDHCLGRQFALLGHGIGNDKRGVTIKLALTLKAHASAFSKELNHEGVALLKTIARNGFSKTAEETLQKMGNATSRTDNPKACFLCGDKFRDVDNLASKVLILLEDYDYSNFLIGITLPMNIAEREDEFKAEFAVHYGENLRNEFGRLIGKAVSVLSGKTAEFKKPEIVALVNPFTEEIGLQINPFFVAGRYRKLVRGIPQSKWFCSNCRGKGCRKCKGTGKLYPESVQEIIEKPLLDATEGSEASFHSSGREDVDARMLGEGRPFVIEISKPRKRFLNLGQIEEEINAYGGGRVAVSGLKPADKTVIRKLKKGELTQKEYRVIIEFKNKIMKEDLRLLKEELSNIVVKQETPLRVLHRRADLTREKYIYEVDIKKLSLKKAELNVRCQGGLYVKELVTGDEGRTTPNISDILKNEAKPIRLDVLSVLMEDW